MAEGTQEDVSDSEYSASTVVEHEVGFGDSHNRGKENESTRTSDKKRRKYNSNNGTNRQSSNQIRRNSRSDNNNNNADSNNNSSGSSNSDSDREAVVRQRVKAVVMVSVFCVVLSLASFVASLGISNSPVGVVASVLECVVAVGIFGVGLFGVLKEGSTLFVVGSACFFSLLRSHSYSATRIRMYIYAYMRLPLYKVIRVWLFGSVRTDPAFLALYTVFGICMALGQTLWVVLGSYTIYQLHASLRVTRDEEQIASIKGILRSCQTYVAAAALSIVGYSLAALFTRRLVTVYQENSGNPKKRIQGKTRDPTTSEGNVTHNGHASVAVASPFP